MPTILDTRHARLRHAHLVMTGPSLGCIYNVLLVKWRFAYYIIGKAPFDKIYVSPYSWIPYMLYGQDGLYIMTAVIPGLRN